MTQDNIQDSGPKPVVRAPRHTIQQQNFLKSEAGTMARNELKLMVADPDYNTRSSFSVIEPDGVSFVDKHMKYLSEHPKLNYQHYLSNLKLITKLRY